MEMGGKSLVYIREVIAKDVMSELTEDGAGEMADIPAETVLYALHAADGERIALVGNRELAFAAARPKRNDSGQRSLEPGLHRQKLNDLNAPPRQPYYAA